MRKFFINLFVGLIGLVTAGVATTRAQSGRDVIQPKSTSPFEIARVVNKSKRMWDKSHIGLDVDLGDTWQRLGIDSGNFAGCGGDCEAIIDRQDLDPTHGREVILKLTQSYNSCRYLIFVRVKGKPPNRGRWKLRSYIDHDFNRYEMSSHRVVRAFGKSWLVIRGQEGSGSGYALYSETWYRISRNGAVAVLSYPVEGRTYPWPTGVGREFKGRAPSALPGGVDHIVVRYDVNYTTLNYIKDHFEKLFVNHHRVVYSWDHKTGAFVFDPTRSDLSETELNAIAGIESEEEQESGTKIGGTTFYTSTETKAFVGGGYEVFLKYNSDRLMKIATGRSSGRKQWLLEFLKECDETTEKKALLRALQK